MHAADGSSTRLNVNHSLDYWRLLADRWWEVIRRCRVDFARLEVSIRTHDVGFNCGELGGAPLT